MICDNCGLFIEEGARYCGDCGAGFDPASVQATEASSTSPFNEPTAAETGHDSSASPIRTFDPLPSMSPPAAKTGISTPPPPPPNLPLSSRDVRAPAMPSNRARVIVAIGAAAVVVLALAAFWIWNRSNKPLAIDAIGAGKTRVEPGETDSFEHTGPPSKASIPPTPPQTTNPPELNTSTTSVASNDGSRILNPGVQNSPPTIRLRSQSTRVTQGEDVEIAADAGPGNKDLRITWTSSIGDLGVGSAITLKTGSIQPGQVQVRATATDPRGLSVSDSVLITVIPRPSPPPAIARLDLDRTRVTAGEKVMLTVHPSREDPDLTYQWRTSAGTFERNGATAVLDTSGVQNAAQITVTAIVSDSQGRTAYQSAYIAIKQPVAASQEKPLRAEPAYAAARMVGDDLIVTISGSAVPANTSRGAIEVTALMDGTTRCFGYLPTGTNRWHLIEGENTKSKSIVFQETPSPSNGFSRLVVRLKANNNHKPVRFTILWQQV